MVIRELKRGVVYVVALLSLGGLFLAYQLRAPLDVDVGQGGTSISLADFTTRTAAIESPTAGAAAFPPYASAASPPGPRHSSSAAASIPGADI